MEEVEANRSQMVSATNGRKTSGGTSSHNTSTTANSPSYAQSGDSCLPNATIDDRPATEVRLVRQEDCSDDQQQEMRTFLSWRNVLDRELLCRDSERDQLLSYFMEGIKQPTSLVLVTGPSGSGKTRLVQQVFSDYFSFENGYFVSSRIDRIARSGPYSSIAMAFDEWAAKVISRKQVQKMRSRVLRTLEDQDIAALVAVIPSLEPILIASAQGPTDIFEKASTQRFVVAFPQFLQAISSESTPLVLFIDGLQYADRYLLDLLTLAMRGREGSGGFVIVGSCDTDLVGVDDYLSVKLREIESWTTKDIPNVNLQPLSELGTTQLLQTVLGAKDASSLGMFLWDQTRGNLKLILSALAQMEDADLLFVENERWKWEDIAIRSTFQLRPFEDVLTSSLNRLSPRTRIGLQTAACLGDTLNLVVLRRVLDEDPKTWLEEAEKSQLVTELSGSFQFSCDQCHRVVLESIVDRPILHLETGRRLWRKLERSELDLYVYTILSQVNEGKDLVVEPQEKQRLARLCLHAGKAAAKASSFNRACCFLDMGLFLLKGMSWSKYYDLTLALHNVSAETLMFHGDFEKMNRVIDAIFRHARTSGDRLHARRTLIHNLAVRNRTQESIKLGLESLADLGEPIDETGFGSKAKLLFELQRVKRKLKGKSDEQIFRLPPISDTEKLEVLRFLHLLIVASLITRPSLFPFLALKGVRITIDYGLSPLSSCFFCIYGMLCLPLGSRGTADEAFRFGELSLKLLDKYKTMEYYPQVHGLFYGAIYCWKKPILDTAVFLLRAHSIGMSTGDYTFASMCGCLRCLHAMFGSNHMATVQREFEGFMHLMHQKCQQTCIEMLAPWAQTIHHFLGLSEDPLSPRGDLIDYDLAESQAREQGLPVQEMAIKFARLIVVYVFNDFDAAAKHTFPIDNVNKIPPSMERILFLLFSGLTATAMARKGVAPRRNVRKARKCLKLLRKWSRLSPENCLGYFLLLNAELESLANHPEEARANYLMAIATANEWDLRFLSGQANEHAARHFLRLDDKVTARYFLDNALHAYDAWGGIAKVKQLSSQVEVLYNQEN